MSAATASTASRTRPRRRLRGGGGGGERTAPYVFLAPFVLLFIGFLVVPIGLAIWNSLHTVRRSGLGFGSASETVFTGLSNYTEALTDAEFLAGLGRVLLYGVVQVPVMLALALTLALLFDSAAVRFKRFLQLSVFLPYAVPAVVAALLWGFLYQPQVSPVVDVLRSLGADPDFLAPGTVLWSIANVTVWSVTGVNMIIIFSALQTVPRDIYEAARIDGAGEFRTALRIKIPMVAPAIILTALFSVIGTLQLFNEPMVMRSVTSNVSSEYTPNMMIFSTTTQGGNINLGSAMAILLGLVTFALSVAVSVASNRRGGKR
ncbi:carbohydrate ABC transporter permease [Phytoactinopolyspora halotolerans]|uniref:Sugar ABC transporter permease n=1 Tax=Phytoactinopolyspora halotolerans TaxID=1981512 RepID=A0A6L9S082_9ACTN|nr:sugar ABC transporter permease [Phytoactinopolyspora halotolerans]NED98814.1 sugar ABC transporter permease [Phytoactinopolyspora halotolerans]